MRVEDPGQLLVRLVVTVGAQRRGSAGELDLGQQRRHAPHQQDTLGLGGKFGGGGGVAAPAGQDRLDELSAGRPQRPAAFGQQPGGFFGGRPGQACLAEQQRRPPLAEQDLAEHAQPAAGPQPGRCRGEKPHRLLAWLPRPRRRSPGGGPDRQYPSRAGAGPAAPGPPRRARPGRSAPTPTAAADRRRLPARPRPRRSSAAWSAGPGWTSSTVAPRPRACAAPGRCPRLGASGRPGRRARPAAGCRTGWRLPWSRGPRTAGAGPPVPGPAARPHQAAAASSASRPRS